MSKDCVPPSVAVTPVNCAPLPMKNPKEDTFPPEEFTCPVTITFGALRTLVNTLEASTFPLAETFPEMFMA
ncbi:hypothetical protein FR483_n063L [Paramecium bursaria Chlorella virus FR483]|uniref:Uncharacterized protein n063L n=1 Tax=Paramecium bursaria Chlorella virus FR483 TaxID=399781 RepID=A7J6B7_PBCVF|nr:hypothetical protein FR483_n063L [Paramecium bursaria Chlorella virus FR483]ABT15348.1 hypothetical protein FR483_n063L [Paramecium bursaria Chlorella virus FR483]